MSVARPLLDLDIRQAAEPLALAVGGAAGCPRSRRNRHAGADFHHAANCAEADDLHAATRWADAVLSRLADSAAICALCTAMAPCELSPS